MIDWVRAKKDVFFFFTRSRKASISAVLQRVPVSMPDWDICDFTVSAENSLAISLFPSTLCLRMMIQTRETCNN